MYVCMYECMCVCVCVYVFMYVCINVCMYVCMCLMSSEIWSLDFRPTKEKSNKYASVCYTRYPFTHLPLGYLLTDMRELRFGSECYRVRDYSMVYCTSQ